MNGHPIELRRLSRRFRRRTVVRELSLEIAAGEVFALLGPNGAGKTTTVKMLMNLLRPSSGLARVLGVDSRRLGPAELAQIGYVAEDQQIPGWMSGRQLADYLRPLYPTWDRELCGRLRHELDLPFDRRVRKLSRGERMKIALLLALAFRPRLLVLDEPFSGLDPANRADLVDGFLEMVAGEGVTVLVCSHDMPTLSRLADRVGLLREGELLLEEELATLLARFREVEVVVAGDARLPEPVPGEWLRPGVSGPTARFVHSRFAGEETLAEVRARFADVRDLQTRPLTLDEIFIAASRPGGARRRAEAA